MGAFTINARYSRFEAFSNAMFFYIVTASNHLVTRGLDVVLLVTSKALFDL